MQIDSVYAALAERGDVLIIADGIAVARLPGVVDQKWPTLKQALLDSARAWWRDHCAASANTAPLHRDIG